MHFPSPSGLFGRLFFAPVLAVVALGLFACGRSWERVPTSNASGQPLLPGEPSPEDLVSLRVREAFVVVFPRDFAVDEWRGIFERTRELSFNKTRLRRIEGRSDLDSESERLERIGRNVELLTELGERSLFMMSWTLADENCRFRSGPKLVCRPFNRDNPLNGGLPEQVGQLLFFRPDPILDAIKTPYWSLALEQRDPVWGPWYRLDLRLRTEVATPQEIVLKGESLPAEGSGFPGPDGLPVTSYFPYGYAELTLSP
jgi:hypothetical protein